MRATIALLLGLCLVIGAAMADVYFHRGVETGAETPYVAQATGRELAINVDFSGFPQDQLDSVAAALQSNGYRYVRFSVLWRAVEPAPGTFVWDHYDAIMQAVTNHGLEPVLVLHGSPDWAREESTRGQPDAPPADISTFATFVSEAVSRYGDSVQFVQIWDLPNRPDQWGGVPASPTKYLSLLAEGSNAARTANAEAQIILAELDPAPMEQSVGADLRFLRELYVLSGASAFFDIVSIRLDGGTASPYDRSVNRGETNLSRAILFRQLMVEEDDANKVLWATHYGWDGGDGPDAVGRERQADFIVSGLRRARAEWPWMGLMFAWDFMPGNEDAGYALLTGDGVATEAFTALAEFARDGDTGIAATGFVPMDSMPVDYRGTWSNQHLNRRTFRFTSEVGATATLTFRGTGVIAILRISPQVETIHVSIDDKPLEGRPGTDTASEIDLNWIQAEDVPVELASGMDDGIHRLEISLAEPGRLTIGGLIVTREAPFMWPVVTLGLAGGVLVMFALRELAYVTALRAGYLQRREGIELRPPLPVLPDWRPMQRA